MDFTSPWVLAFLPLSLTPLVLHLFFHRQRSRVDFSSLIFFEKKKRYFAFRRYLLEILLLLCRMLIIALVIFALARPCFKRFAFLKNAGIEMVIILDDTMSMQRLIPGGITAFDQACHHAEALLDTLSGEDGAGLVFLSGKNGIPITRDKNKIRKALKNASVTASSGSFSSIVAVSADQLERTPGINRELHIISDFRKTAAPLRPIDSKNLKKIRVFVDKIGGPVENMALSDVQPESDVCVPGSPIRIPFSVRTFSASERTAVVSLEIGGRVIQTQSIPVQPGKTARGFFLFTPESIGRVEGFVTLRDTSIPMDDRIPFAFTVSEVSKVALATAEDTENDPWFYLRPAIDPLPEKPLYGYRTSRIKASALASLQPKQYSVLFLQPEITLTRESVAAILRFLQKGGLVFVFPETEGSVRFYRDLTRYSNGVIPPLYSGNGCKVFSGLYFEPPLNMLNDTLQLELVSGNRLTPPSEKGGIVLARSGKMPVIVFRRIGSGYLTAFGFTLRRGPSNWPELKSFPVAMLRVLQVLSARNLRHIQAECGSLIAADAETFTDAAGYTEKLLSKQFRVPWSPAVIRFNGGTVDTLSAIPSVRAGNPEQLTSSAIRDCFQQKITLLEPGHPVEAQVAALRRGTELTGPALFLALLLCAFEFILGAKPPVFRIPDDKPERKN